MRIKLEYDNPRQHTGGRCAWDYALFGVCLSVYVLMAGFLLAVLVGFIR